MASALYAAGPGPGAYLLPTTVGYDKHDTRKIRMPQYSFGLKNGIRSRTVGPGPGAYNLNNVTRYGGKFSPAYTLGLKTKAKGPGDIGPGPGAYAIQNIPIFTGPRPPAYTMAQRTGLKVRNLNPGPNQYEVKLNFTKPGPPAFSLGLRTPIPGTKSQSPGPAAYAVADNCKILRCPPAYSIASRHAGIAYKQTIPGANQYNLQNFRPGKSGPQFSFGMKHSPYAPPLVVQCDN